MKSFAEWVKKLNEVNYEFSVGDAVEDRSGRTGTIDSMVPGDGITPWYYVSWDDGTQDRHTGDELKSAQRKEPRRFRGW
jgi:hypothetical protein